VRASSGPVTRKEARILRASSAWAAWVRITLARMRTWRRAGSYSTSAPSQRSSASIVWTSARSGTLSKTHSSSVSSAAAISGSAAFFEPPIATVPRSGLPPVTRIVVASRPRRLVISVTLAVMSSP
jgi:hypothetical protein